MAEKIGLEAVMDMAGFNKGMKQYTGGIDDMTDKTEKGSSIFSKLGGALTTVAKIGIGAAVVGFGALTAVIADSVQEAANAQKVEAQLEAVLKATGGTAGMTKDEIIGLADALSQVTPYEDDLIIATETMLLQFRNIGEDVFPQATEMALDLATRLGIDATSAAKLLGKALEEPGEGLTRLRQAGVSFTDEQQAMIDKMVATGDIAGAQKLIMDELSNSIGGAATAAGETFAGRMTILQNTLGNLKETIGTAFLPVLTTLAEKFTSFVQENGPQIEAFFQSVADWTINKLIPALVEIYNWLATNLPPAIQTISEFWTGTLQPALQTVWEFISTKVIPILTDVYNWLATNIPPAIQTLSDFWTGTLQPALEDVWDFISINVLPIFEKVSGWFSGEGTSSATGWVDVIKDKVGKILTFMSEEFGWIIDWVKENWPLIQETVEKVMTKIKEVIDKILTAIKDFWEEHGDKIKKIVGDMWDIIKRIIDTAIKLVGGIIKTAMQIITGDWSGAWETIKKTLGIVWDNLKKIVMDALDIIKNELAIAWDIIRDAVIKAWDTIKDKLNTAWDAIKKVVDDSITAIKTKLTEAWDAIKNKVSETWDAIKETINKAVTFIKETVIGAITDLIVKFEDVVSTVKNKVIDIFNKLMAKGGEIVGNFAWVQSWIQNVSEAFQWIVDAIRDVIEWLQKLVKTIQELELPTWLTGGSPPPLAYWFEDIGEAVQGLADAALPDLQAKLNLGLGEMSIPRQTMIPAAAGAGQNVNVSFGDTTINSGLDVSLFQAQVLQTVTRAVRGY